MKNMLKRLMGIDKLEKEKLKLLEETDPKAAATAKGEPYIAVIDTQVNPDNIKNGFFELDWNNEFIEKLLDAGYKGETNEQIVDGWFKTIASNILKEEGLDPTRGAGYINVKDIGKDKSEIS